MVIGRVIMGVACVAAAGAAEAAQPIRLPLILHALATGTEVAYHPYRWLTIRRSILSTRIVLLRDEPLAAAPVAPLRKIEALTGDVHPFGDGMRLSFGFRQDSNRRLLRMRGDGADTATGRFMPMIAAGVAGEVAPRFAVAADIGFLGRSFAHEGGGVLVTPIERARADRGPRIYPQVQLSAGYRF